MCIRDRFDGAEQIVADAGLDQIAVQRDIVAIAEENQPCCGGAMLGQSINQSDNVLRGTALFDEDDIRGRIILVPVDRHLKAAFEQGDFDPTSPPVSAQLFDCQNVF